MALAGLRTTLRNLLSLIELFVAVHDPRIVCYEVASFKFAECCSRKEKFSDRVTSVPLPP